MNFQTFMFSTISFAHLQLPKTIHSNKYTHRHTKSKNIGEKGGGGRREEGGEREEEGVKTMP